MKKYLPKGFLNNQFGILLVLTACVSMVATFAFLLTTKTEKERVAAFNKYILEETIKSCKEHPEIKCVVIPPYYNPQA